jgi:hypothetical protein
VISFIAVFLISIAFLISQASIALRYSGYFGSFPQVSTIVVAYIFIQKIKIKNTQILNTYLFLNIKIKYKIKLQFRALKRCRLIEKTKDTCTYRFISFMLYMVSFQL